MDEVEEFLAHYGVKGMKWGVRKQNQLDNYTRVADGKASVTQRLNVYASMSLLEIAVAGGGKKAAANRAAGLAAQKARIESGKSTVFDKMDRAMNTSVIDLARGR